MRPVGLGHFVPRVGDAGLQLAVVGEQQQSFAVQVQPPGDIDARQRDEAGQGGAALGAVGELGQHAVGFVEQDQPGHRAAPIIPPRAGALVTM